MESRRNGPQLSSRHDDDDDVENRKVASCKTSKSKINLFEYTQLST